MSKITSTKFYSVTMPDGVVYATEGKSIRAVADECGVDQSQVMVGANLGATPGIAKYHKRMEIEEEF